MQTLLEALAASGVDAWVFIDDVWYLMNPDGTYVLLETRTVGYDGVLVKRFDELDLDAVDKIVGSTADTALLEPVEGELEKQLEGRSHAARSQVYYLDITNLDANKGTAVRELAARGRAARSRGRARRHGQRYGDVRDRRRVDRDGTGVGESAARGEPAVVEQALRSRSMRCSRCGKAKGVKEGHRRGLYGPGRADGPRRSSG